MLLGLGNNSGDPNTGIFSSHCREGRRQHSGFLTAQQPTERGKGTQTWRQAQALWVSSSSPNTSHGHVQGFDGPYPLLGWHKSTRHFLGVASPLEAFTPCSPPAQHWEPKELSDTRQAMVRFFSSLNSILHEPQKPDGPNMKSEHGNLCSLHFPNFLSNPLVTQVILLQG